MIKSKIAILFYLLSITCFSCSHASYLSFTSNYTKKECQQIEANLDRLKIGMERTEVISLIGKESRYKLYSNSGLFPEHNTQWEVWLLCKDPKSCMFVQHLERRRCYESYMIAFDVKTDKLIKVFSYDPEMAGFF